MAARVTLESVIWWSMTITTKTDTARSGRIPGESSLLENVLKCKIKVHFTKRFIEITIMKHSECYFTDMSMEPLERFSSFHPCLSIYKGRGSLSHDALDQEGERASTSRGKDSSGKRPLPLNQDLEASLPCTRKSDGEGAVDFVYFQFN